MLNGDGRFHLPMYAEATPRPQRPKTRGDCLEGGVNEGRPCPWIGCRYNLAEADPKKHTCALDVADEGGVTLEEVGELMGVTRERIRQVEAKALRRIMKTDSLYRRHLRERLRELK
jgi:hypothetical protein